MPKIYLRSDLFLAQLVELIVQPVRNCLSVTYFTGFIGPHITCLCAASCSLQSMGCLYIEWNVEAAES